MDSEDKVGEEERGNYIHSYRWNVKLHNSFNNNDYFVQRLSSNVFIGIRHSEWMSEYIHEEKKILNESPNICALKNSMNI